MVLDALEIRDLRNIDHMLIRANRSLNLFVGGNGAGKTSILEGVFLLARGRSFRGGNLGSVIREGTTRASLSCVAIGKNGRRIRLGFIRDRNASNLMCDDRPIGSFCDLEERLHVRFVGENAQRLMEGEPAVRRLFLDWNLFHVEQRYRDTLRGFRRVLRQRNAWLRSGGQGAPIWDTDYVAFSAEITAKRRRLVAELCERNRQFVDLPMGRNLERLVYRQGWPESEDLMESLARTRRNDVDRGYTYYGPGRADFSLSMGVRGGRLSRGQAKVVVFLLHWASQGVWRDNAGLSCIWLLDDLHAELDKDSVSFLWSLLGAQQAQIFLTSLDTGGKVLPESVSVDSSLFHVEQGALVHDGQRA
jgi:DNA replication and repair protein RecF